MNILFSASEDKTIRTWDCKQMKPLQLFNYHTARIHLMLLNNRTLITSSSDGMIYFYDYVAETIEAKFRKKDGKIFSFAYDSKTLFMGSEAENILKISQEELLQDAKSQQKGRTTPRQK